MIIVRDITWDLSFNAGLTMSFSSALECVIQ